MSSISFQAGLLLPTGMVIGSETEKAWLTAAQMSNLALTADLTKNWTAVHVEASGISKHD